MSEYIYDMPCLSRYKFNHLGECMNIKTGGLPATRSRPNSPAPHYQLVDDMGKNANVSVREVIQYIKHLKQVQEFNPMVFHHFIIYRPVLRVMSNWKNYNPKPLPVADL